jgi:glycosyltransferase involved in cell wall biosynthesis
MPAQDAREKDRLRKKFGIPPQKFVILHVGHINRDRNLEALVPLQGRDRQVLIVSSSSTSSVSYEDERLKRVLKSAGIIIIDGFLDQIEEVYRLSDLYVFPVVRETGCISLPLSVLEAMASGLPVLTSEFGGLQELFKKPGHGLRYELPSRFLEAVQAIRQNRNEPSGREDVGLANRLFSRTLQTIIDG